jgi:hypothetical protein
VSAQRKLDAHPPARQNYGSARRQRQLLIGCNAQEKCEWRGAGGSPLAGLPPKMKRRPVGGTHVGASSGAGKNHSGRNTTFHSVINLGQIRAGLQNPVIFDRTKTNVVCADHDSQLREAILAVNTTQLSS